LIFETSIRSHNKRSNRNFLSLLQVPCLSIMLRQEELAFIKAPSTMQPSPALLKEIWTALASSKKKRKTAVSAGSRGTTLSGAPKAFQHPPSLSAGKRKANELVSSDGSTQTAKRRRPRAGAACAPLPVFTSVTSEQANLGSWQLAPPEDGVTYAAALAGPVAPSQPSGSLKPTSIDSDMSKPMSRPRQPIGACLVTCPGL
jgi:hypothetical protein